MSTLYETDAAGSVQEEEPQQDYDDGDEEEEEEEEEEDEEDYPQRPPRRQTSSSSGVGAEIRNAFLAGRMREGDVMEEDEEEEEKKVEEQKVHVEDSQQEQDDAMLPADDVVHAPVAEEFVDAEGGTEAAGEHQKTVVDESAEAKTEHETVPPSEPQDTPPASDVPVGAENVPQPNAQQPVVEEPQTQDSHASIIATAPVAAVAALITPAATTPVPSATFLVPEARKNERKQSTPVLNNQFGQSASEVSLPKPTAAATAMPAQKPRGAALLQMSHPNQSAPVIGNAAKTAPAKKSKSRFAKCFSWLPGVSKKKDAAGIADNNTRSVPPPMTAAPATPKPQVKPTPAPAATKSDTPVINDIKPTVHAVTEKRSIASFNKGKAPATAAAAAASLHAPSLKEEQGLVVNASTGKPPFTPEAANARSGSPVNAVARSSSSSPAPRVDSLLGVVTPPPRDIDSVSATGSTSSERRSIFRGGRNASREHMSEEYRLDKSNNSLRLAGSRKGSVSTASQRTAPENSERGIADDKHHHDDGDADDDDDDEDAINSSGASAEVYTLHSRASQMTLSLPEMPKLGNLDVAIPPAPGRTELPYHSASAAPTTITAAAQSLNGDTDRESSASSPVRRTTSKSAEQEENEKLELLRAVVGDSTRHVKESAAAHRRRWDEELQGSDTSSGRAAAAAATASGIINNAQIGPIPRSSLEQQQRSVRSSLLYDGLSRSASSGTTATAGAATAAVVTPPATPSSSTARLTSPSRLFLNQDFQQGAFSLTPFGSSYTSLASSSSRAPPAAATQAQQQQQQLDPLEKLYHDICNSGMDLDQLAGKYDSNATRRPTAKRNGSSVGKMVGGAAAIMPNTPPRSVVAGGAAAAAAAAAIVSGGAIGGDAYAGNNAIDGWRKNIARALESTHSANRSATTTAAAAAPLSPPPSPAYHHSYNHNDNHNELSSAAPSGIRQKALVSRRTAAGGAAPRANIDRQAVWSLHEDFVAALDGTDGDADNDLAGVVGFALAMHDGQA
ncbi:hypothetical protein HDU87_006510 [Geranomyces variabilis]|uniref:Uncharacterized protein n=1 Tax=Geranomyces variabilis TaxID=109894 RepID=A0AAD5XNV8_9FUNG|nr:hypothetical protein HDU87_006510 [Geranomyces variabilis]